ncbi:chaperone protein dnaJ 49-like [Typha angustifolia]|uniref:chaperone protein dnaJ 49-like n=1 Tax=Typha angustifolia TaxID=59011 RepID=UPI003C2BDB47
MEGNKDEAIKCVRIGQEALGSGDRARALKFLSKARRLDPTLPIDDLLSTASGLGGSQSSPSPDDSAASSDGPQPEMPNKGSLSSSSTTAPAKSRSSPDGSSASYTGEQAAIVRQIKKQKDYYQILGLEKGCTVDDVRKAYRKLSLKVHPDKNKAPGAEEAFKVVSKAFRCLSDEESRKRYDLVGTDEPSYSRVPTRRRSHGFDGFYEADVDADEIFRNFFFGGMAPATTFHFRTGNTGAHGMRDSGNSNLRMFIQILPFIILLLLNFLPSPDPVYVLSRSYPYDHKLETPRGVNYFVKSAKFEEEYPEQSSERIALEKRVEREYVGLLTQNCRLELQRRQWGLSYQTPHCDRLQKFDTTA